MLEYISEGRICYACMSEIAEGSHKCRHCGEKANAVTNELNHLPVGTILAGKYLVGKALGQGGFGITYIGLSLVTNTKVAIKECFPQGIVSRAHTDFDIVTASSGEHRTWFEKTKERFLDEAELLASFAHIPNIVNVLDFFNDNGTAYIVMEFVEGKTILQLAKDNGGRLPAERVLNYIIPIMESLTEIHSKNLLHRDIAPDNIMIRESDDKAVLLDFGAARQVSAEGEKTNSLTIQVKHGYAPEEQYRTHGKQGPWTDVYALCATIYRLTTGGTPTQAIDRLGGDLPLEPPNNKGAGFTDKQQAALMKGLSIYGKDRQQSMDELIKELQIIKEPEPVLAKDRVSVFEYAPKKTIIAAYSIIIVALLLIPPPFGLLLLAILFVVFSRIKLKGIEYSATDDGICITQYTGKNKYVVIPQKISNKPVVSIGMGAFYASAVSKVYLPSGLKEIKEQAFFNCVELKSIRIPNSVETIGEAAFYGCCTLADLNLPYNLSSVGEMAFAGCTALNQEAATEGLA